MDRNRKRPERKSSDLLAGRDEGEEAASGTSEWPGLCLCLNEHSAYKGVTLREPSPASKLKAHV